MYIYIYIVDIKKAIVEVKINYKNGWHVMIGI